MRALEFENWARQFASFFSDTLTASEAVDAILRHIDSGVFSIPNIAGVRM